MEHCSKCSAPAEGFAKIYSPYKEFPMCHPCAFKWLEETSRCPKCGGTVKECHPEKVLGAIEKKSCRWHGFLDRGFTPAYTPPTKWFIYWKFKHLPQVYGVGPMDLTKATKRGAALNTDSAIKCRMSTSTRAT